MGVIYIFSTLINLCHEWAHDHAAHLLCPLTQTIAALKIFHCITIQNILVAPNWPTHRLGSAAEAVRAKSPRTRNVIAIADLMIRE